jgi:hypothetical protein
MGYTVGSTPFNSVEINTFRMNSKALTCSMFDEVARLNILLGDSNISDESTASCGASVFEAPLHGNTAVVNNDALSRATFCGARHSVGRVALWVQKRNGVMIL